MAFLTCGTKRATRARSHVQYCRRQRIQGTHGAELGVCRDKDKYSFDRPKVVSDFRVIRDVVHQLKLVRTSLKVSTKLFTFHRIVP